MTDEKIEWRKEEAGFSLRKKPQILVSKVTVIPIYPIFRSEFKHFILYPIQFA